MSPVPMLTRSASSLLVYESKCQVSWQGSNCAKAAFEESTLNAWSKRPGVTNPKRMDYQIGSHVAEERVLRAFWIRRLRSTDQRTSCASAVRQQHIPSERIPQLDVFPAGILASRRLRPGLRGSFWCGRPKSPCSGRVLGHQGWIQHRLNSDAAARRPPIAGIRIRWSRPCSWLSR
jgi:hypothetical protein